MSEVNLLAYHGTIQTFADSIISSKKYIIKNRDNHWMGDGIYFFENDLDEAKWWAGNTKKLNKNKGLTKEQLYRTVLTNNITVCRDKFYDDCTTTDQKKLEDFINSNSQVIEKLVLNNNKINKTKKYENIEKIIRGNIIYSFCLINQYDVAKCTFEKPNSVSVSQFSQRLTYGFQNSAIQLCVYNNKVIDFTSIKKEVFK